MPTLLWPFSNAATTAWMHSSWYSRSCTGSGGTRCAGSTAAGLTALFREALLHPPKGGPGGPRPRDKTGPRAHAHLGGLEARQPYEAALEPRRSGGRMAERSLAVGARSKRGKWKSEPPCFFFDATYRHRDPPHCEARCRRMVFPCNSGIPVCHSRSALCSEEVHIAESTGTEVTPVTLRTRMNPRSRNWNGRITPGRASSKPSAPSPSCLQTLTTE